MDMAHIKLLVAELRSLTIYPSVPPSFSRPLSRSSISNAEILGIVVSLESKPEFLRFLLDDGTGCIPCILRLKHRHVSSTSYQNLMVEFTGCHARMVKLGEQLRVRGRITVFRGELEITVRDVLVERDPNMETLHRLDCVRIAQQFMRCDSLGNHGGEDTEAHNWLPEDTSDIPLQEEGPIAEQEQVLVESANTEDSL